MLKPENSFSIYMPKPLSASERSTAAFMNSAAQTAAASSTQPNGFFFSPPRSLFSLPAAARVRKPRKKFPNGSLMSALNASTGSICPLSPSRSLPLRDMTHQIRKAWTKTKSSNRSRAQTWLRLNTVDKTHTAKQPSHTKLSPAGRPPRKSSSAAPTSSAPTGSHSHKVSMPLKSDTV